MPHLVHSMWKERWLYGESIAEARVVRGEKTAFQSCIRIDDAVFFMDGDNR
jgi:hypothetical protein